MMHVDSLQRFFASSPAVRLLRSPHAFWIVDFLHRQFKQAGQITRLHAELAAELDAYLDHLAQRSELPDEPELSKKLWGSKDSREKADAYLANWCAPSTGWLKRFIDEGQTEASYQLTAEFEKALAFVESASREVAFVGTASRLRTILDTLGQVAAGVNDDPQVRIRQLQQQRDAIDAQLQLVRTSPAAGRMSAAQVKERFWLATQQLQQLKSEFRAVEDRFKAITRGVQTKVLAAAETRGDILQFAFDSEDTLKREDQGQSFFEFLRTLHSPDFQERMAELVASLSQTQELADEHEDLDALRSMVPTLIAEAEKILRTTQHLSSTLRRLLDARATRHHQQLGSVLRDILAAAANRSEQPPPEFGLEIEVELQIQAAVDRPFWLATEPFDEVQLQAVEVQPEAQARALQQLVALERLDWSRLRENIAESVESGPVSLHELLVRYPVQAGAVEVLGYLQLAFDDGHRIDASEAFTLTGVPLRAGRQLSIPQVWFLPTRDRQQRQAACISFVSATES